MTTRRLLSLIHGAIGVLLALFIIVVGGSGAALAFMSEMFMAEYDQVLRVEVEKTEPYADVDRLIAGAKEGFGRGLTTFGVFMPYTRIEDAETAIVFGLPEGSTRGLEDTWMISVDPWTGAYKGDFRLNDAFGYQLVDFHHELSGGEIAGVFVAALGLLLAAFALTGVWLWWPRGGSAWRKAWPPDVRGGARRAWFRLHGWTGVWIGLLIVLFSLTGTGAARPDWFGPLLSELHEAPTDAGFERVCEGQVTPGQAVRGAETKWPGRRLASLYFPFEPGKPYRMAFRAPGDLNTLDGDFVVFAHTACSDVLYGSDMGRGSLPDRAATIMLSLHGGYPLGILGDILVIVTGIALVLLSGSGVYVFFTRTLRFGARKQPARSNETVPQPGLRAEG
jgi:uncharacterized iron-regulated membrane protein